MKKNFLFLLLLILSPVFSHAQNVENIAGIGAQLILDTAGGYTMPRIFSLVPNSPAYQSLNATDYIIKVNDISCKDKTIEEVVALIRGVVGTSVKITTGDTKEGKNPKNFTLTRVGMQIPVAQPAAPPPDPATTFFEACDNEAKQLKKNGVEIIKTFNSECGNFFFNFNAESGMYRIRVFTMEEKGKGAYTPSFSATAKVFDGDNEAGATELARSGATDKNSYMVAQLDGAVTFKRTCVGVVGIIIHDDIKKCRGMYVIVYK